MASGVKILLAGLLVTYVISSVLTKSDSAKYSQDITQSLLKAFVQDSESCEDFSLENGKVTYNKSPVSSNPDRRPLHTVALFSCNEGYDLVNSKQQMCQERGVWSGGDRLKPSCNVNSCQRMFPDSGGCCTEGKCMVGTDSLNNKCSCSVDCYTDQKLNCCSDIGCPRRSCIEAGLVTTSRNCSWGDTNGCYLPDKNCYCDPKCCNRTDCCSDVKKLWQCGHSTSKSARQDLTGDLVVRELASELRSLSRAQELSNEQQRAEWEAILSELQEIQKEE